MLYVAVFVEPEPSGLPKVFTPIEAARLLRHLGLTEITECALRTRAYRKQVPFHLNGRRIIFTLADLREILKARHAGPSRELLGARRRLPPGQRHADTWPAVTAPRSCPPGGPSRSHDLARCKCHGRGFYGMTFVPCYAVTLGSWTCSAHLAAVRAIA